MDDPTIWNICSDLNKLEYDQRLEPNVQTAAGRLSHEVMDMQSRVESPGGYWHDLKGKNDKVIFKAAVQLLKRRIAEAAKQMKVLNDALRFSKHDDLRKEMLPRLQRRWNAILEIIAGQFPKTRPADKVTFIPGDRSSEGLAFLS